MATVYVIHYPSAYDNSESRYSLDTPEDTAAIVEDLVARNRMPLAIYAWTGPTKAPCACCGQHLQLSLGEWRNQHGFPTCPMAAEYPYRHEPAGVQQVPACGQLPDWWQE